MSDIKVGDLVMVVRASNCCGSTSRIGEIFRAGEVSPGNTKCHRCGFRAVGTVTVENPDSGLWIHPNRLIKIDPPAKGDSLPTRADLEVTA